MIKINIEVDEFIVEEIVKQAIKIIQKSSAYEIVKYAPCDGGVENVPFSEVELVKSIITTFKRG